MVGKRQSEAKEVINSSPNFKKTRLNDLLKVFYLNQKTQKIDYFLLNTYQRAEALPSLSVGSVRSMLLVNGTKHDFFSRMKLKTSILNFAYAG